MSDLISRADAIEVVHRYFVEEFNNEPYETDEDGDEVFTDMKSVNKLLAHNKAVSKAIKALPSAEAESIVIRSRTLLPTKDFKEWAKRIREVNPNTIVIPCDAEVVSAEAVHGKWIPCSERLPSEKDGRVLVTKRDEVMTATYSEFSGRWYLGDMCAVGGENPIAWMPLPMPYREDGEV